MQEEFVAQVQAEETLGIPVTKYLCEEKPKLESGFINVFALPLWKKLHALLPEVGDRVEQLTHNFTTWQKMLEKDGPHA